MICLIINDQIAPIILGGRQIVDLEHEQHAVYASSNTASFKYCIIAANIMRNFGGRRLITCTTHIAAGYFAHQYAHRNTIVPGFSSKKETGRKTATRGDSDSCTLHLSRHSHCDFKYDGARVRNSVVSTHLLVIRLAYYKQNFFCRLWTEAVHNVSSSSSRARGQRT